MSISREVGLQPTAPTARISRTSESSKIMDSDAAGLSLTINDPFEKRFKSAQQGRLEAFLKEERRRESRFQAVEAAREDAEAERDKDFDQKEKTRSMKFQDMLGSHEEHYHGREVVRSNGDVRREEVFNAANERRSHMFAMMLSEIEKQAEAGDSLEESLMNHMKSTTESLSTRHLAQLEAAREDQSIRFRDAQRRRDAELGVPVATLTLPTFPRSRRTPSASPPEGHHTVPAPTIIHPESRGSSGSRSSRPVALLSWGPLILASDWLLCGSLAQRPGGAGSTSNFWVRNCYKGRVTSGDDVPELPTQVSTHI
ncbi:hypothetical protein FPV67DRAFT_241925 [Lyophyllum atratum]|nr:hypothetical protein FPV67DRAFT_241925 [Lyophyllum atratum]